MINEQYYEQLIEDLAPDMPETARDIRDLLNGYRDMQSKAVKALTEQLTAERKAAGC